MAKKVKNKVQASSRVSNPNQPIKQSETLIFDFSYKKWLQGVRTQGFTNMLKDDAQFAQYIVHIFQKLIPIVQDNWKDIKKQHGNFRHCHTFAPDKLDLVKEITDEIHGKPLFDDEVANEYNFWQLGIQQGVRMIAIYNHDTNVMYPIFIDYHHQIYPDVKYNEKDIDAYAFCPLNRYA